MILRSALVLVLVSFGSCTSGSGGGSISIRPGVSTIHAGGVAKTPGCTAYDPALCPAFEEVDVLDVDVDGNRVGVVRLLGDQNIMVDLSDDLGVTWKEVQVKQALGDDLAWDYHGVGVHLQNGRVFIFLTRSRIGPLNQTYVDWWWGPLDVATGNLAISMTNRTGPCSFFTRRPDGKVRCMLVDGDPRGGPKFLHLYDVDPDADTVSEIFPITCQGAACFLDFPRAGPDGETFDGFGNDEFTQVCRFHWASAGTGSYCVTRGDWPLTNSTANTHIHHAANGEAYQVWEKNGAAYASTVTLDATPVVPPAIPLGPGKVTDLKIGLGGKARFEGLELIEELNPPTTRTAQGRLVRIGANGPEEVKFPGTPCVSDDSCGYTGGPTYGYRLVQWIQPLDGGQSLVFYTVQSQSEDNQQTLYVSKETPTVTPFTADPLVLGPSPFAAWPDALPMTNLEKECERYAGCVPYNGVTNYKQCVGHWMTETSTFPWQSNALARFEASASSCDTLLAAFPEQLNHNYSGCSAACYATGGTCDAGVCSTEIPGGDYSNCLTCSGSTFYWCPSNTMGQFAGKFRIDCGAAGYRCQNLDGCLSATPCPTMFMPMCTAGGALTVCDPSDTVGTQHCELVGAQCSATTPPAGACVPPADRGESGCGDDFPQHCEHRNVVACSVGKIHYVDCAELGFSECDAGACD